MSSKEKPSKEPTPQKTPSEEEEETIYHEVEEDEFADFLSAEALKVVKVERGAKYFHLVIACFLTFGLTIVGGMLPGVNPLAAIVVAIFLPPFIVFVLDHTGDTFLGWIVKKTAMLRLKAFKKKDKKNDDDDSNRTNGS